jgi:DNA-binding GntR family transcriptional regulator
MTTVQPIRHRTLRANIVQTLREAIQQRRLAPGTRLSDSELAAQLGVSHSTVREALHQLTHERLVVSAPHRGFFVAGFTLDDQIDLLEMRGLLEGRIAEAVAHDLTDADFAALAEAAAAIKRIQQADNGTFWDADRAFHEIILRRCTKTVVVELWSSLSSRLTMQELLFHDAFMAGLSDAHAHHLAYLEELRTRDPGRARRAAEDHYRNPVECLRRVRARAKEVAGGG